MLGGLTHAGMPALKDRAKFVVDDAGTDLQDVVATAVRPAHLLLLDEAARDDLVDGRLSERLFKTECWRADKALQARDNWFRCTLQAS